jgi:hypothetical protein
VERLDRPAASLGQAPVHVTSPRSIDTPRAARIIRAHRRHCRERPVGRKGLHMQKAESGRGRRSGIVLLLVLSVLILTLTVVYASVLDDWGGTRGLIYKIVALASLGLALLSLLVLVLDSLTARRHRRAGHTGHTQ